jgi:hypothetical protein
VRVVLLNLDKSLGLRSRPRKGVPPRPRPRPPRPPPPRRGRETTIFLRDRSNACGVVGVGLSSGPPLVDSTKRNVSRRNTTKALQKDFRPSGRDLRPFWSEISSRGSEISIVQVICSTSFITNKYSEREFFSMPDFERDIA